MRDWQKSSQAQDGTLHNRGDTPDREAERIGEILRRFAPASNRSGWIAECADAMDIGESTFKACVYGNSAPHADTFHKLVHHFGAPFLNAYLEPFGLVVVPKDGAALFDAAAELVGEIGERADVLATLLRERK